MSVKQLIRYVSIGVLASGSGGDRLLEAIDLAIGLRCLVAAAPLSRMIHPDELLGRQAAVHELRFDGAVAGVRPSVAAARRRPRSRGPLAGRLVARRQLDGLARRREPRRHTRAVNRYLKVDNPSS